MDRSKIKKLDQILTDFLWDGKRAKIAKNTLCSLKEDGGIGLANLELKDKALKAQWVFKAALNDYVQNLADVLLKKPNWMTDLGMSNDTPGCKSLCKYRSGTVNSKSFVGKVLLRIKRKFELN